MWAVNSAQRPSFVYSLLIAVPTSSFILAWQVIWTEIVNNERMTITRTALGRAHTSAKAAGPAKKLLPLDNRRVKRTPAISKGQTWSVLR